MKFKSWIPFCFQVRDCVVEGLEGIQESLEWTVDMTQKR